MADDDLYQIVYVSVATRPLSPPDLAGILELARRKNEAEGITGMLLYRHGHFLQLLEGPQARVAALFEKLNSDPRHGGIRVLVEGPIKARAFGSWSMAFQDISGLEPNTMPGYSRFLTKGFGSSECLRYPQKALRLLLAFRQTDLKQFESQVHASM